MKPYTPDGKVLALLKAIEADPLREFTSAEAAQIMCIDARAVAAAIGGARYNGLVFCRVERRRMVIRGTPYPKEAPAFPVRTWSPDNDIRVQRVVAGWRPPVMVAPRAGSAR